MAQNVKIHGTTYSSVPSVQIPLADDSGSATFYDTSDATMLAQYLYAGYTGYGASGKVTGSMTTVTVSQDSTTKVLTIS